MGRTSVCEFTFTWLSRFKHQTKHMSEYGEEELIEGGEFSKFIKKRLKRGVPLPDEFDQGDILLRKETLLSFFEGPVDRTLGYVYAALRKCKVEQVVSVGGFSTSSVLQDALRAFCEDKGLVYRVPPQPGVPPMPDLPTLAPLDERGMSRSDAARKPCGIVRDWIHTIYIGLSVQFQTKKENFKRLSFS